MAKRRSDRNHLIYKIENLSNGDFYIGVTVVSGRAYLKSLRSRWKRHIYKATILREEWSFSKAIREFGESQFKLEIMEIVRGKSTAFERESSIINDLRPTYNTRMRCS
jgi:predicted GIY-YIG superfamily endonuclease